jgi:alpha-mannosidase
VRPAIITGVKQAEDDKDLVVRFYETSGRTAPDAKPKLTFNTLGFATVNFVEDPLKEVDPASALRSHEIRTLKIAAAVK